MKTNNWPTYGFCTALAVTSLLFTFLLLGKFRPVLVDVLYRDFGRPFETEWPWPFLALPAIQAGLLGVLIWKGRIRNWRIGWAAATALFLGALIVGTVWLLLMPPTMEVLPISD